MVRVWFATSDEKIAENISSTPTGFKFIDGEALGTSSSLEPKQSLLIHNLNESTGNPLSYKSTLRSTWKDYGCRRNFGWK